MNFFPFLFLLNILLIVTPSFCEEEVHQALKSNVLCLESEREALLSFKKDIIDPAHRLSSWNASSELDCCKWAGVSCNNVTGHVIELCLGHPPPSESDLYLASYYEIEAKYQAYMRAELGGKINPSLQHLKHLRVLDLSYNDFNGTSIPAFIGSLVSLQQLNLSRAGFGGIIPSQIGNLSSLQSLGLAATFPYGDLIFKNNNLRWLSGLPLRRLQLDGTDLSGVSNWPHIMNSFSSLHELSLSGCRLPTSFSSLLLTPNFSSSLTILDISENQLGPSIPCWIFSLHNLVSLNLCGNFFQGAIPVGLQNLTLLLTPNFSSSLTILDISGNQLGPSIPCWIFCLHNLVSLNLGFNGFQGVIPVALQNLTLLRHLDLDQNGFNSTLPDWVHNFTRMEFLNIRANNLTGLQHRSLWGLCRLKVLDLSRNLIVANMSDIFGSWVGECASPGLQELALACNSIFGPLPESFWQLSLLKVLAIENNKLDGIVSEVQLNNLSTLEELWASENSFILNVSDNWVPSFGLQTLDLGGWKLGPQFPLWLQTQKDLIQLNLSNTGISDSIPLWFWNMSTNLYFLNLAHNQIYGNLPNILYSKPSAEIILSSNHFDGPLSILSSNINLLDLSNNAFSGEIAHLLHSSDIEILDLSNNSFSGDITDFLCVRARKHTLIGLNLQNNNFSGEIPDCWKDWQSLQLLWLGNNYFSGQIPSSMGYLKDLQSLHLQNNRLSGTLPQSLQKCSSLVTLDLSRNSFTGNLPTWIGKFHGSMQFLNLRSNRLEGKIPIKLCYLAHLQILDIAQNNFSGRIPTCFKNLAAMTLSQRKSNTVWYYLDMTVLVEYMQIVEKGYDNVYDKILGLVSTMDLSGNNLSGEIPNELMDLDGLVSLNLSQNHFIGTIPKKIGDMRFLESLDLSWNQLSGKIPFSISDLSFLSYLNLSHNNLTGPIPSCTQLEGLDPSAFSGNNLCGPPLPRICGAHIQLPSYDEDLNEKDSIWFYLGMPWGFVMGFWCVIGPLLVKKYWRLVYFQFLDQTWEKFSIIIFECKKFLS